MLFFIKMKLSSRLCLTHKRVTQKYRNSTLIKKKKKNCARIGSESAILRIFWIGSDRIWKNGIVASLFRTMESRRLRMHSGSFWVKGRCTIIRRSLNASNSSALRPSSSSGNTIGVRETKGRAEEMQKEIWTEKGVCVGVRVLCR